MGFDDIRHKNKFVKNKAEYRQDNRYPIETNVDIVCGHFKQQFKTVECSASGFSINKTVPADLDARICSYTIVYISSDRRRIEVYGEAMLIPGALNRFRVITPDGGLTNFLEEIWAGS